MDRLLRLGAGGMPSLGGSAPPSDAPAVDTAEQVYISSLALLKVLSFVFHRFLIINYEALNFLHTALCQ